MQKRKFQRKTNAFSRPPINFHSQCPPRWGGNGWAPLNGNFAEVTQVPRPLRGREMLALTIAHGRGPSAPRVPTIALGRPRRPAAAPQPGEDVPEEAAAPSAAAANPGRLPGRSQALPGAREGGGAAAGSSSSTPPARAPPGASPQRCPAHRDGRGPPAMAAQGGLRSAAYAALPGPRRASPA